MSPSPHPEPQELMRSPTAPDAISSGYEEDENPLVSVMSNVKLGDDISTEQESLSNGSKMEEETVQESKTHESNGNSTREHSELLDITPLIVTQTSIKTEHYFKDSDWENVTFYAKKVDRQSLRINFTEDTIVILFQSNDRTFRRKMNYTLNPRKPQLDEDESPFFERTFLLKHQIVPEKCEYVVGGPKIDLNLAKKIPGKWDSLERITERYRQGKKPQNGSANGEWTPVEQGKGKNRQGRRKTGSDSPGSPVPDDSSIISRKPMEPSSPKKGPHLGYTGLDNLGNTCFMNSVLQCLANTKEFRDYFIQRAFQQDINEDNPLGSKGQIAFSFAVLMNQLWSGNLSSFKAGKLKSLLSDKVHQFSGYGQHDAQEYMAFLLDALHEDLNRVKKKPYVDMDLDKEAETWTDEMLAAESWRRYKKRDNSIVLDLFSGQYKSKLTCPICDKVSVTFDPFLYLSVPIPKKQFYDVYFFRDSTKKPVKYALSLPSNSNAKDLAASLSDKSKALTDKIKLILVEGGLVKQILSGNTKLPPSISSNEAIFAFECSPSEETKDANEQYVYLLVYHRLKYPPLKYGRFKCSKCQKLPPSSNTPSRRESVSSIGEDDVVLTPSARPAGALRRCTRCMRTRYCGSECQQADYPSHKTMCSYKPETVGHPFLLHVPKSKCTPTHLCELISQYSRFSIDVNNDKDATSPVKKEPSSLPPENIPSTSKDSQTLENGIHSDSNEEDVPQNGSCQQARPKYPFNLRIVSTDLEKEIKIDKKSLEDIQGHQGDIVPLNKAANKPILEAIKANGILAVEWFNNPEPKQSNSGQSSQSSTTPSFHVILETKSEVDHSFDIIEGAAARREPASVSLSDCLKLFTEQETLSPEEAWYCPRCKKHREATKELSLWKFPLILVIHLKRFKVKREYSIWRDKNDKLIDFPVTGLNMAEFRPSSADGYGDAPGLRPGPVYDLFGVVNHYGGMYSGHYTAYAKSVYEGKDYGWRCFDDSRVSRVDSEDIVSRSGYILFYRIRE